MSEIKKCLLQEQSFQRKFTHDPKRLLLSLMLMTAMSGCQFLEDEVENLYAQCKVDLVLAEIEYPESRENSYCSRKLREGLREVSRLNVRDVTKVNADLGIPGDRYEYGALSKRNLLRRPEANFIQESPDKEELLKIAGDFVAFVDTHREEFYMTRWTYPQAVPYVISSLLVKMYPSTFYTENCGHYDGGRIYCMVKK